MGSFGQRSGEPEDATFSITAVEGDASELHFRRHGLTPELECIEMCTRSWDNFIVSLRDYAEVGRGMPFGSRGMPFGSGEDNARRLREGGTTE